MTLMKGGGKWQSEGRGTVELNAIESPPLDFEAKCYLRVRSVSPVIRLVVMSCSAQLRVATAHR